MNNPSQSAIAPSTTTTASSKSNGFSPGEVAGIALGAGIGLALIAALVTWLVMRRRHSFRSRKRARETELIDLQDGMLPQQPGTWLLDNHLPQSAYFDDMKRKVEDLFTRVENWAYYYYEAKPGSETEVAPAELSALNTPHLSKRLGNLLPRAQPVYPLITHAVNYYISRRITPAAPAEERLLPAHMALLANARNKSEPRYAGQSDPTRSRFGN